MISNSTTRFSNRVENYVKFRPEYPAEVLSLLIQECQLNENSEVADVGAGTGIFTKVLLRVARCVYAVEPNAEMRAAAEKLLNEKAGFVSVNGTSESTSLPDNSVDIITAAQAFHWFHPENTKNEFRRIAKRDAFLVLIWNERRTESTAFLRDYEKLLQKFATDYNEVDHRRIDEKALNKFYAPATFESTSFENKQLFDWDGLRGRLLSSSYAPDASHPSHHAMLQELKVLFESFQNNGKVSFDYDTNIYWGKIK